MKVLIVNNMAPFVWGGAEELAVNLTKNLILAGHEAEVLRIPFQWEPATGIPSQMLMVRALELSNVDKVIVLKFPAYLIRHPNKVFWLLHQYRQAYDLYDAGQTNLPPGKIGDDIRSLIKRADGQSFAESRKIFTNSEVTRQRLRQYNGYNAEVLLPPVNDPEIFVGGAAQDYIFVGGRINSMKRQHLFVEALRYAGKNVKLLVAGPPDAPEDGEKLKSLVAQYGLEAQVTLDIRFLPRSTYANYVRGAMAVAYAPYDEDSLGYVAMEGAIAGKPLITMSDSGGILGLVKAGVTGWVSEPDLQSVAEALTSVYSDRNKTRALGDSAQKFWTDLGINWHATIEKLMQ